MNNELNSGEEKKTGSLALEYTRRIFVCVLGLFIYELGVCLGVKAGDVGTNAWSTLNMGFMNVFGMSLGTATLITGVGIILIDLLGKGKLGLGTFLNWVLLSYFADLIMKKIFIYLPDPNNTYVAVACTLIGQTIVSFATILYMQPELGCGPRDTLMVIVGKLVPKVPIGAVKFCIELVALGIGFLMGAPVGIGTLLVMLLQSGIFQLACRFCRYEPRNIHHEDLPETFRRIFKRQ